MSTGLTAIERSAPARRGGESLRPKRRGWVLVAGLLAMVVSAGAFALVYLGSDAREQVLVVARPVPAGQAVTAADLRVARIVPDSGLDALSAHTAQNVIGRTAAVPLAAGSLLADSQLGPPAWPPAGQVVVAVPVKAVRLVAGITPGSQVLVVLPAGQGPTSSIVSSRAGAAMSRAVAPAPIPGTVMALTPNADGSGTAVVSLLLRRADAVGVASASADVSLVLAGH